MAAPIMKPWGSFVSWDEVRRGFKRRHGMDPLFSLSDTWLHLAACASEDGQPDRADRYFAAGLFREAYDRDTYEPPVELQREFGSSPVTLT